MTGSLVNGVLTIPGRAETRGRPRKYHQDRAATSTERSRTLYKNKLEYKLDHMAIWDTETDPFDNTKEGEIILPFVGCLYSPNFDPIVIWDEDYTSFVDQWIDALENLEGSYTIYAHNGGKFDFMFLLHKMRGKVSFKGRGIMSAKLGRHELRDSFHIIPEKLSAFHKETFDYELMRKNKRGKHRDEIVKYLISDCVYLYDFVKAFLDRFGFKISIGQAAMSEMNKVYPVGKIGQNTDATLRTWYFGGRVECLAGKGHWKGDYKLYDRNSMYPAVMVECKHPQSANYERRTKGGIKANTVFIDLTCNSYGAMIERRQSAEDGQWGTNAVWGRGRFYTTIWEYQAALELGLIDHIVIHACVDNEKLDNFEKVIVPWYGNRLITKDTMRELKKQGVDPESEKFLEVKKDDLFWKYLLNNSYGKYAQNPRKYKENYITDWDAPAPPGFEEIMLPKFKTKPGADPSYAIWEKPAPRHVFNNVGTAASITGAARASLMRAIAGAVDPIYCDTDSIVCKSVSGLNISDTELGAWKLEAEFSEVLIAGKKLYACRSIDKAEKDKLKSKGASGLVWEDMEALLRGEVIKTINKGVTISKTGAQFYMTRNIRATAKNRDTKHGYGTPERIQSNERASA